MKKQMGLSFQLTSQYMVAKTQTPGQLINQLI